MQKIVEFTRAADGVGAGERRIMNADDAAALRRRGGVRIVGDAPAAVVEPPRSPSTRPPRPEVVKK